MLRDNILYSDKTNFSENQSINKSLTRDKFFIIKSFNKQNLVKSIETGFWATTKKNFEKFYYCLNTDDRVKNVYLFFSINESRGFQGIAKIVNIKKDPIDGIFVDTQGRTCKWENVIEVIWVSKFFLNFEKCKGLRNPLNENKQIKISRDGQELEYRVGKRIFDMIITEGEEWITTGLFLESSMMGVNSSQGNIPHRKKNNHHQSNNDAVNLIPHLLQNNPSLLSNNTFLNSEGKKSGMKMNLNQGNKHNKISSDASLISSLPTMEGGILKEFLLMQQPSQLSNNATIEVPNGSLPRKAPDQVSEDSNDVFLKSKRVLVQQSQAQVANQSQTQPIPDEQYKSDHSDVEVKKQKKIDYETSSEGSKEAFSLNSKHSSNRLRNEEKSDKKTVNKDLKRKRKTYSKSQEYKFESYTLKDTKYYSKNIDYKEYRDDREFNRYDKDKDKDKASYRRTSYRDKEYNDKYHDKLKRPFKDDKKNPYDRERDEKEKNRYSGNFYEQKYKSNLSSGKYDSRYYDSNVINPNNEFKYETPNKFKSRSQDYNKSSIRNTISNKTKNHNYEDYVNDYSDHKISPRNPIENKYIFGTNDQHLKINQPQSFPYATPNYPNTHTFSPYPTENAFYDNYGMSSHKRDMNFYNNHYIYNNPKYYVNYYQPPSYYPNMRYESNEATTYGRYQPNSLDYNGNGSPQYTPNKSKNQNFRSKDKQKHKNLNIKKDDLNYQNYNLKDAGQISNLGQDKTEYKQIVYDYYDD